MASLDDILTATKNVVTALNNGAQTFLTVNGLKTQTNITAATVLKTSAGRVAVVSIIVGGTGSPLAGGGTNGVIVDSNSTSSLTNVIFTIPNTPGVVFLNMPTSNGIVVSPGPGQTVAVSFS